MDENGPPGSLLLNCCLGRHQPTSRLGLPSGHSFRIIAALKPSYGYLPLPET